MARGAFAREEKAIMRAYGKKKIRTAIAGHQKCGICHPAQKSMTTRGRREGKHDAGCESQARAV